MPRIAIALGSNIDAENNLQRAADMLRGHFPDIRFSRVYRSAPLLRTDQSEFLNAVAVCVSDERPESIAETLRSIEQALGKAPPYRYGPRTIDLDLLLCGETVIDGNNLQVPHPRMHERRFVLEPLCELIDPQKRHPILGETWSALLQKNLGQTCVPTPQVL